jgi:hypothetical protein
MQALLAEKTPLYFVSCGSVDEGSEAGDVPVGCVLSHLRLGLNQPEEFSLDEGDSVDAALDEAPARATWLRRHVHTNDTGSRHGPTRYAHSEGPQVSKAHQRPYSSEPMTMRTAANTTRASHWIAFPEPLSSP